MMPRRTLTLLALAAALGACSLLYPYDQAVSVGGEGGSSASGGGQGGAAVTTSGGGAGGMAPPDCSKKPDMCKGMCVDFKTDPNACGGCDPIFVCQSERVCIAGLCVLPPSCKALRDGRSGTPSGVYKLDYDGAEANTQPPSSAYCEMNADGGGWTLLMKVGPNGQFSYYGKWDSTSTFNESSPDLDDTEAKLAGCFLMPFTQLRLGMKEIGANEIRWILLSFAGLSLCDLFKSGTAFPANSKPETWTPLLKAPSLPGTSCFKEGVNAAGQVRIGLIGSSGSCGSYDSAIGFGFNSSFEVGGYVGNTDHKAKMLTKAFGYVMAR